MGKFTRNKISYKKRTKKNIHRKKIKNKHLSRRKKSLNKKNHKRYTRKRVKGGNDPEFPIDDKTRLEVTSSPEYRKYLWNCRTKNPFTGRYSDKNTSYCKKEKANIENMYSPGHREAITDADPSVQKDLAFVRNYIPPSRDENNFEETNPLI